MSETSKTLHDDLSHARERQAFYADKVQFGEWVPKAQREVWAAIGKQWAKRVDELWEQLQAAQAGAEQVRK